MRAWLLTNTTYGTWLPGDNRGSVTSVRDQRPTDPPNHARFEHDMPGEPWEDPNEALQVSAKEIMQGNPIFLDVEKAEFLLKQFQETATHRVWALRAVAIMANHFHLVVIVPEDPDPGRILADFKAYGSRVLNRQYGKPPSETWWTTNGSKRKLTDEDAIAAAIHYVLYKQSYAVDLTTSWDGGMEGLL